MLKRYGPFKLRLAFRPLSSNAMAAKAKAKAQGSMKPKAKAKAQGSRPDAAKKVMKEVQKKPATAQGCLFAYGNAHPPREGGHRLPASDVMAIHQVLPGTDLNHMVELVFDVKDIETLGFVMTLRDLVGDGQMDTSFSFNSVHAEKDHGATVQRLERMNIKGDASKKLPDSHYLRFATKFYRSQEEVMSSLRGSK